MRRLRDRLSGEDGLTLIELLIVIGLMGLVSGAITTALIVGLNTVDDTATRFVNANNRNFGSRYLIPDIQAHDAAVTPACDGPGTTVRDCSAIPTPADCTATSQPVLGLQGNAVDDGGPSAASEYTVTVATTYSVVSDGDDCTLVREQRKMGSDVEGDTDPALCPARGCTWATDTGPVVLANDLRPQDPISITYYDPRTNPGSPYERPTVKVRIADDPGLPPGSYSYDVTASSRVGRM